MCSQIRFNLTMKTVKYKYSREKEALALSGYAVLLPEKYVKKFEHQLEDLLAKDESKPVVSKWRPDINETFYKIDFDWPSGYHASTHFEHFDEVDILMRRGLLFRTAKEARSTYKMIMKFLKHPISCSEPKPVGECKHRWGYDDDICEKCGKEKDLFPIRKPVELQDMKPIDLMDEDKRGRRTYVKWQYKEIEKKLNELVERFNNFTKGR